MTISIDWAALGIELTDEQKAEFEKQAESEVDKERTKASTTAAANAKKKADKEAQDAIESLANEKAKKLLEALTLTEAEKIEAAKAEIEAEKQQILQERKLNAVTAKLKAAGYGDEQVAQLAPVFTAGADIASCEQAVDAVIGASTAQITAKTDAIRAELTNGGTAPGMNKGGTAPVVNEAKVLANVYDKVNSDGFVNTIASNRQLDLEAVMALDNLQPGS